MDDMRVWVVLGIGLGFVVWFIKLLDTRWHAQLQRAQHHDEQQTERVRAQEARQPVPYHYSPHTQYQYQGGAVAAGALPGPAPLISEVAALELPGITTLGTVMAGGWRPSAQEILLALGPGARRVVTPVGNKMVHVIICGATGAGKTNLLRLLLAQLVSIGHAVYLCNVKYTPVHPDTGEDWRPIVARTVPRRALTDLDEQVELLRWLAEDEMPARLARFNTGQDVGEPLHVALDEVPALVAHDKRASEYIAALLRMGRELKIDLILVAQDVLVSTLGGNSGHRAQMQTRYCGPGDRTSFQVLIQKEVPGRVLPPPPLEPGVLYLYSAVLREPELVRVPLVTNADLYSLLGAPVDAPSAPSPAPVAPSAPVVGEVVDARPEGAREGEPPWVPEGARAAILAGLRAGKRTNLIIKDVFGVSGGREYIRAAEYISTIMSDLARQAAA